MPHFSKGTPKPSVLFERHLTFFKEVPNLFKQTPRYSIRRQIFKGAQGFSANGDSKKMFEKRKSFKNQLQPETKIEVLQITNS